MSASIKWSKEAATPRMILRRREFVKAYVASTSTVWMDSTKAAKGTAGAHVHEANAARHMGIITNKKERFVSGPISRFLAEDHRRLEDLLARALAGSGGLDLNAYGEFRAGLLRHIGMEETILIPAAQRGGGRDHLPMAAKIRLDHGALAALLVPPPSLDIISAIGAILSDHNLFEEGSGGLYETCERLLGHGVQALLETLRKRPYPRLKPHVSSPGILDATRSALTRAGYDLDELVRRGSR